MTLTTPILLNLCGAESEIIATVDYDYRPGSPDTYDASRGGPGGWDPGYPPEIEINSVKVKHVESQAARTIDVMGWLNEDQLDALREEIAEKHPSVSGPDPDDARDRERDDRAARYSP